jgi:hypothetical protein
MSPAHGSVSLLHWHFYEYNYYIAWFRFIVDVDVRMSCKTTANGNSSSRVYNPSESSLFTPTIFHSIPFSSLINIPRHLPYSFLLRVVSSLSLNALFRIKTPQLKTTDLKPFKLGTSRLLKPSSLHKISRAQLFSSLLTPAVSQITHLSVKFALPPFSLDHHLLLSVLRPLLFSSALVGVSLLSS